MEVKTVKFELYPQKEPTGYAVGFHVVTNERVLYRDSIVSFSELSSETDDEIIETAWEKIKPTLDFESLKLKTENPVIGRKFKVNQDNNLEEIMKSVEPVVPEEDPVNPADPTNPAKKA